MSIELYNQFTYMTPNNAMKNNLNLINSRSMC